MQLKIAPYHADYVQRQIAEIRKIAPRLETIRTDYIPELQGTNDPTVRIYPRQTAVVEGDHARSFTLSLWRSRALDQTKKLGDYLKAPDVVEQVRDLASTIAGCNPVGAWPIHPVDGVDPVVISSSTPPQGVSDATRQYLMDALADIADALPTTKEISVSYAVTHTANHVQRLRPFFAFSNGQREIASIESNMLLTLMRHELGSPKAADHHERNETRIGLLLQQLQLERPDFLLIAHLLPLFGSNYQPTILRLR